MTWSDPEAFEDCSHLNSTDEIMVCINDILAATNCQVSVVWLWLWIHQFLPLSIINLFTGVPLRCPSIPLLDILLLKPLFCSKMDVTVTELYVWNKSKPSFRRMSNTWYWRQALGFWLSTLSMTHNKPQTVIIFFLIFFIFVYFSSRNYTAMASYRIVILDLEQDNETIAKGNFYRQDSLISPK